MSVEVAASRVIACRRDNVTSGLGITGAGERAEALEVRYYEDTHRFSGVWMSCKALTDLADWWMSCKALN